MADGGTPMQNWKGTTSAAGTMSRAANRLPLPGR
jgi:hypothetical protein